MTFTVPSLPRACRWINQPVDWRVSPEQSLTITAGACTDWFIDPAGADAKHNAPVALFTPPDDTFILSAKVTVAFASTFDAGVVQVYARDDLWAKVCFEYAPQRRPMVVSVVTRGLSDDSNGPTIDDTEVYLRIARTARAFAFHYSRDGAYWHLVRHFSLGPVDSVEVGLAAQSPTGQGCAATFSEVTYQRGEPADIRDGA